MFQDYESLGWINPTLVRPVILEAYRGTDIIQWYGNIERQLQNFVNDTERSNNEPYATKLTTFLNKVWRPNEITGSINRETLEALLSGATVLAVDDWTYQNYFSNLRDQLRKLIGSEEELPRIPTDSGEPLQGTSRGGGGPPLGDFGPEEEPPMGGEPGMEGDIEPGMETAELGAEGEAGAEGEFEREQEFEETP